MKLTYGLQMQQQQKLIMTTELRQALEVLQRPVLELRQLIEAELLQNPLLEQAGEAEAEDEVGLEARAESEPGGETAVVEPDRASEDAAASEWINYFHDGRDVGLAPGPSRDGDGQSDPEAAWSAASTLAEHLLFQLSTADLAEPDRRIGEYLIGSLDDNGLLAIAVEEAAAQLGCGVADVERVLRVVQGFDPSGVGACDLRECLRIQWAGLGLDHPLVPKIIEHHLQDIAAGRAQRVAAALGVTPAAVQAAVDLIRQLDPKPGRRFGHPDDARYVIPDLTVERVGSEYVVIVNDAPLPRVTVSPHYRRLLRDADGETKKYLESKLHSAIWFMRSVEQRRFTLYRVMEAIVVAQRGFFDHGVRRLAPLTQRQIADRVGIHESTVSRATANKYVQTPRGIFSMRFFFDSGISPGAGGAVAAESIKRMIGDLIDGEDKRRPLSDQNLTDLLVARGVPVSRRTVAKYREEMGVLPSSQRRRFD